MAEEDRPQKHSISSGGRITYSRSSKRQKQNKVPQRGLGVTKLERIRLEEVQIMKGDASSTNSSFNLPLTLAKFHPSSQISLASSPTCA
ncbi:putative transcription factor NOZZLE family [Lupinus albus]|uniref:Putative transcription factor NOZZLE family n=1 Tax=Lupinus albus TaxID=3870 RepID=A0A6A4QQJ8_LUPAL|nr:putative transcription factor NOZZLE family [Lupinus albus]